MSNSYSITKASIKSFQLPAYHLQTLQMIDEAIEAQQINADIISIFPIAANRLGELPKLKSKKRAGQWTPKKDRNKRR